MSENDRSAVISTTARSAMSPGENSERKRLQNWSNSGLLRPRRTSMMSPTDTALG
eukprot:CAMPEP_0195112634 /NCGR_PEP_ID=MMETSP0448-20130528/99705_1 /TAXON_ID=66468 /ORGANISM="Heterocapsa triquestra, Strain CCMP 448" /LENGTH=54 /DNA_ID=CAMNT_0040149497 /DNA_START=77 /DNA_END=237 /DNA_ORIENTATION=+